MACNRYGASYLFQPDKMYDSSWDTGDKTFQCGRHVDALKLWLMWKVKVRKTVLSHGFTGKNCLYTTKTVKKNNYVSFFSVA